MKGNKQIFSSSRDERIKGYKKLFKAKGNDYDPPKDIAKGIVEAMEAQGYEVDEKQVMAYMKSSYAVFDRNYFTNTRR
tara:strand:- start:1084 stop:1317 length:234 start_codon:yes stop_codon:yes gene_type:complete